MQLLWHFTGRAQPFADTVQGLQVTDFRLGTDGQIALPIKGDLLKLTVSGRGDHEWFKCTGRTFDFASSDGPVLHINLELA
jgi:hypothetical protein